MGVAAIAAQAQKPAAATGRWGRWAAWTRKPRAGLRRSLPAPLKITFGDKSATWTPSTLAALPHTTVTVYNDHTKANETYAGVPLIDLLTPLGVRGKAERQGIAAVCGGRGLRRLRSGLLHRRSHSLHVHDATVIVADSENGKPLTDTGHSSWLLQAKNIRRAGCATWLQFACWRRSERGPASRPLLSQVPIRNLGAANSIGELTGSVTGVLRYRPWSGSEPAPWALRCDPPALGG